MVREGQGPDLQTKRAAVTLVAMICDDARLQKVLPQIFVLNERIMSQADFNEVAGKCEDNVFMIRRKSSWVNADLMVQIIELLRKCLKSELVNRHTILRMDTCPAHMKPSVLRACADLGVHVHFVPALTTSWLQPLDVLAFAPLKSWISRDMEQRRLACESGILSKLDVLDLWRRAVDAVLRFREWGNAFDLCGLRGQGLLSKRLMARLRYSMPPVVANGLPSLGDLQATFPAGTNIPIDALFEAAMSKEVGPRRVMLRLPASATLPQAPPAR